MAEAFEQGKILCVKTTGELVTLVSVNENGTWDANRPVMTRDGILHRTDSFFPFELETQESHLNREADDMFLKSQIQAALQERIDNAEKQKAEKTLHLVN